MKEFSKEEKQERIAKNVAALINEDPYYTFVNLGVGIPTLVANYISRDDVYILAENGMLGVGGMDKTALRVDKAAVDKEIERMKRLASLGGFIPCPDHRLMPGTKFELVQYYAEEIKKITI